jgi:hypothetical protein
VQEYDCRMSDSDICTTVLLSSWAFHHNSLKLRHSVCEQPMKESLLTFKIVQRMFTVYHSETDRATEWMNQNVELYICTFFNYSQNNWASLLLMIELVINNHDFVSTEVSFFFLSHVSHEAFTTTWEVEACMICKSSVQKADQIVDERSHRVSTDDYDCHSANTERSDELKETAVL